MDTRSLKQFVTLADTLHFGRAGEACHISASALSRSIRQLEAEVGATLFERDNRSVRLTHAGSRFLEYARDTLSHWDAMRNELMADAGELRGEISIYCSVTASYSFLFDLVSAFRSEHPRIEIKLHTGDPEHAVQRVLSGDEDIAIGARPDRMPAALAFKPIRTTPLVFIAASDWAGHAPLTSAAATADSLRSTPMIVSERGLARRRINRWFADRDIEPQIYAQVAGNEAIVSMVSLGFGVGVVPKIVVDNSPLARTVRVLNIRPRLAPFDIGLFALHKRLRSPLVRAFWDKSLISIPNKSS